MKTYKALDVRECRVVGKAEYYKPYVLASSGSVRVPQHIRVVVIAQENNSTNRVRFEFLEAYQYEFLDKIRYGGYLGDWNLLVPGDYFIVEETDAQDRVTILNTL